MLSYSKFIHNTDIVYSFYVTSRRHQVSASKTAKPSNQPEAATRNEFHFTKLHFKLYSLLCTLYPCQAMPKAYINKNKIERVTAPRQATLQLDFHIQHQTYIHSFLHKFKINFEQPFLQHNFSIDINLISCT